jgi:hypothetical protein
MTPTPKFCITIDNTINHTSDTELARLDLNVVRNWTVKSSMDNDAHFNLHDPWERIFIQNAFCISLSCSIACGLDKSLGILIFEFTGEAYFIIS